MSDAMVSQEWDGVSKQKYAYLLKVNHQPGMTDIAKTFHEVPDAIEY